MSGQCPVKNPHQVRWVRWRGRSMVNSSSLKSRSRSTDYKMDCPFLAARLPCRFTTITIIIIITGVSPVTTGHVGVNDAKICRFLENPDVCIQEAKVLMYCQNMWSYFGFCCFVCFVVCSGLSDAHTKTKQSRWMRTERTCGGFYQSKEAFRFYSHFSGWLEDFLPAGALSRSKGMMVNTYMEFWVRKWAEKKKNYKKETSQKEERSCLKLKHICVSQP